MQAKRIRKIILVGCGYIAQRAYLPLLSQWPKIEIVGVFSRSQARLDEISLRWGNLPGFTDFEKLLKQEANGTRTVACTHYN